MQGGGQGGRVGQSVSFQTDHTAEQRKCNSPSATSGYVPTAISVTSDRLFNM